MQLRVSQSSAKHNNNILLYSDNFELARRYRRVRHNILLRRKQCVISGANRVSRMRWRLLLSAAASGVQVCMYILLGAGDLQERAARQRVRQIDKLINNNFY